MRCVGNLPRTDDTGWEQLGKIDRKLEVQFEATDRRFDEIASEVRLCQERLGELLRQVVAQASLGATARRHSPRSSRPGSTRRQQASAACMSSAPVASFRTGSMPRTAGQQTSFRGGVLGAEETIKERAEEHEVVPLLATPTASLGMSSWEVHKTSREIGEGEEQLTAFREQLGAAKRVIQQGKAQESCAVRVVTTFLEDAESSFPAWIYSQFVFYFNIFAIVVGLLPMLDLRDPEEDANLDIVIDIFLVAEILTRLAFCPNYGFFFGNVFNIIDLLSGVPLGLQMCLLYYEKEEGKQHWEIMVNRALLVALPVVRLMRFVRRFPHMQILISSFKSCLEALPVLLYNMAILACIFTSMIFLVEPRSNLPNMANSFWLVLSTMTTVGYGDVVPETKWGHALTSFLMIVSPLYMAVPFGIIGHSFTVIWGKRDQILLLKGARDRFAKWGFGPYEILQLFDLFDLDDSAEIDLQEFHILLKEMDIGFRDDEVTELFKHIDRDCGGTIDEREFMRTLYPEEYRIMFGKARTSAVEVGLSSAQIRRFSKHKSIYAP